MGLFRYAIFTKCLFIVPTSVGDFQKLLCERVAPIKTQGPNFCSIRAETHSLDILTTDRATSQRFFFVSEDLEASISGEISITYKFWPNTIHFPYLGESKVKIEDNFEIFY